MGTGSRLRNLNQLYFVLFKTLLPVINKNLNSQSLASGPRLAYMDYIYFGVGHFNFIQGYIINKISLFLGRFGNQSSPIWQISFVKEQTEGVYKLSEQLDTLLILLANL